MNLIMFLYVFALFFVLTPGVLVNLPSRSSKTITALTHAAIFAVVWTFTHKFVWRMTSGIGSATPSTNTLTKPSTIPSLSIPASVTIALNKS